MAKDTCVWGFVRRDGRKKLGLTPKEALPRIEYMFDIGSDSSRLPQRHVRMEPPSLRTKGHRRS
jgi:hypothetical protein